jgi:hypothetical protein
MHAYITLARPLLPNEPSYAASPKRAPKFDLG